MTTNPLICAIDTPERARANFLIKEVSPHVGLIKLGLEFFNTHGPQAISEYANKGIPLFLDLKFHDIPNTVAGAVRGAVNTGCRMLTIHASGGHDMCKAARDAAEETAQRQNIRTPLVLAVTILTSLDAAAVTAIGYRHENPTDQVLHLVDLTLNAGVTGIVCSPQEIAPIRQRFGDTPILVVPGIRPTGSAANDQKRTLTPQEALTAGANYLVIGRPITSAENPATAAKHMLD